MNHEKEIPIEDRPPQPEPTRNTIDPDTGFQADEPGSDLPETYGVIPTVIIGNDFLRPAGTVRVLQEILELPSQVRATAQKTGVGLDGEIHAAPATMSERGGGLRVELKANLTPETVKALPSTHQKASFPKKIHFPKDEFPQKSKAQKTTFRKR